MDPIGKKLLDVAKAELGYQEQAGGYTKFGDWYGKNVEQDPAFKTAPWCDMFLAWAANKTGVKDWAGQFAYTPSHANWFREKGAWGTTPEPGAVVFFAWSGSKDLDSIQHVGLVERVGGDGSVHTIEANTDGVHLKRQVRDSGTIVGYGYPAKVVVPGRSVESVTGAERQGDQRAGEKGKTERGTGERKHVPKHGNHGVSPGEVGDGGTSSGVSSNTLAPGGRPADPVEQEVVLCSLLAAIVIGTAALAVGRSTAARLPASPVRVRKKGRHHRCPAELPAGMVPDDLTAAEDTTATIAAVTETLAQAGPEDDRRVVPAEPVTVAETEAEAEAARTATVSLPRLRRRGKHHRGPVELPDGMTTADLAEADAATESMPAISAAAAAEAEDREFWGRIAHLEEDGELAFWSSLHAAKAEERVEAVR
ncbi:CHAP domain-containing protein [Actinomadura craniellae]|nr:CHAP domain-containing protein [Actinomadura craniellae]